MPQRVKFDRADVGTSSLRQAHNRWMAMGTMSPLGISWGYLVLLLVPAMVIVAALFAVVRRRDIRSPRVWLLVTAGVAAGMWAFFTVGAPVMVSIPDDPQGAECLVDPFGDNPARTVSWTSDCGQALARHLLASGGPVLLLLGVTAGATVRGLRQSRAQSSGTPVAPS